MRKRLVSRSALGCTLASLLNLPVALGQAPPPPPPVPPAVDGADPYAADPYAEAAPPPETTPPATTPPPTASTGTDASLNAGGATEVDGAAAVGTAGPGGEAQADSTTTAVDPYAEGGQAADEEGGSTPDDVAASEEARKARLLSLRRQSSLTGSTGLFRVREAGSSAPGTFRVSVLMGMNSMGNFLCQSSAPCSDPATGAVRLGDSSSRSDMRALLSVTPLPFLEAFAGFRNMATSNSFGRPRVINVMGDWNFGVKAFLPEKLGRIYSAGGEVDLLLLNGSGSVGFDPNATGFSMRGLGGLDFSQLEKPFPVRVLGNVAYTFDNSAAVLGDFETTPPPEGRGEPVERTERYGLDMARVDSLEIGIGAEYMNEWIRPFVEWTVDIPVNRQGYICNISSAASRGDYCLGAAAGFQTTPSRLTLGARGFPWQKSGLGVSVALDIGTGHTGAFIEEATPEAPYTFWLGLSYGVDVAPIPEIRTVAVEPTRPARQMHRFAFGRVVDEKTGEPVADALLRFSDGSRTGLIAGEVGTFMTGDLPPGVYDFKVFAHEYENGVCQLTIPELLPPEAAPAAVAPEGTAAPEGEAAASEGVEGEAVADAAAPESADPTAPYLDVEGDMIVPIRCEVKPLAQVATITGVLVGADSGQSVQDATVVITDKLGRSLSLAVDAQGAFQFRNVPFGSAHLKVSAPGYMPTVRDVTIASRENISSNVVMNPVPKKANVKVTPKELSFSQPITFITNTPDVAVESMSVIEELAHVLAGHPEIAQVEIQVHTDDSGSPTDQRRISQERAVRIGELLTQLGIEQSRLKAKGYGPDQPLAPNISEANRAKNNRVQVVILPQK